MPVHAFEQAQDSFGSQAVLDDFRMESSRWALGGEPLNMQLLLRSDLLMICQKKSGLLLQFRTRFLHMGFRSSKFRVSCLLKVFAQALSRGPTPSPSW